MLQRVLARRVARQLTHIQTTAYQRPPRRLESTLAQKPAQKLSEAPPAPAKPYEGPPEEQVQHSYIVRKIRASPTAFSFVRRFAALIGWQGKKNTAIRASRLMYLQCSERAVAEEELIHNECQIPQTFQTWFQITNLHVWLLTVRFRALPPPYGKLYIQSLIDHFFADIEFRLRHVLGPRVSERTIGGYMREYRDLWNGSQMALDMGIVAGDWEMSSAVWRNLFDARGWDLGGPRDEGGKLLSATDSLSKVDSERSITQDQNLTELPYHLYLFTAFLRRELVRLEALADDDVVSAEVGQFGPIRVPEDDIPKDVVLDTSPPTRGE